VPQVLDYPSITGKSWEWHLVLFKEWFAQVEGSQSQRKYLKWLRTRKVFDRQFIRFTEYLLGVERGAKLSFNDVGNDLLEELEKSRERQAKASEQAGKFEAPPVPSADDDPFLRALLERFCELNPYLCMFGFKELADEFLAPNEIFKRVGTNDFEGRRPTMPQFSGWIRWLEWLGGVKTVGFRCKATKAGMEVSAYLKEMPTEELFADDEDIYAGGEEAAEAAQPEAPAPTPGPTPAVAPSADDEGADDFEDDLLDEEGLDMPPEPEVEADPEVEPFWKRQAQRPGSQIPQEALAEPTPAGSATATAEPPLTEPPLTEPPLAETPLAEPPAVVVPAPAPAVTPSAPAPAAAFTPRPASRPLWQSSVLARPAAADAVPAWLESSEPQVCASAVGLTPDSDPGLHLLRLLALASLLEAGDAQEALALYRQLHEPLAAFFRQESGLEALLEVCWQAEASLACEERLVHLIRYRRGIPTLGDLAQASDARALGRLLRDRVTGPTLNTGLAFVIRELGAAGRWSGEGLDVARWLAWSFEPNSL
jgi:hypothetical protein